MRPTLRSDTLKIKAIDLCSGRDSLPGWHAVLLCSLSVSGALCVCMCAHQSIYKIICACLCASIYVARVNLGSLCEPVRRVQGCLEMEVVLKIFTLPGLVSGGGGGGGGVGWMGMDNCVCVRVWDCCPATDEEGAEVQTDRKQITLRGRAPTVSALFRPSLWTLSYCDLLRKSKYKRKPSKLYLTLWWTYLSINQTRKGSSEVCLLFLNGIHLLCVWLILLAIIVAAVTSQLLK